MPLKNCTNLLFKKERHKLKKLLLLIVLVSHNFLGAMRGDHKELIAETTPPPKPTKEFLDQLFKNTMREGGPQHAWFGVPESIKTLPFSDWKPKS